MSRVVYLAGPYSSRDILRDYREQLTRVGYKVRARWLDGGHEVAENPTVEAEADSAERARWAHEDLEDVRACNMLIAFTSAAVGGGHAGVSGGRHIETGYALGQHKYVMLVGEPENVFHWLPGVQRVPDWHEALIELAAQLVEYERDVPRAAESVPA